MDLATKTTAELKQIEATAKAELEKGRAEGRSEMSTVMRTRYRVLGAAVAALANR